MTAFTHVLPGWEVPKNRPENYATGYGFLTDYLAEIFAELRRLNYQTHVNYWADFGRMTGRNQDAVKKTAAGLLNADRSFVRLKDGQNSKAPIVPDIPSL